VTNVAQQAHGVDLSRGMLTRATGKSLSIAQGSVTALPLPSNAFDLVYRFKVLAHVERIEEALCELARVARPGGHLLLLVLIARKRAPASER
jgi:arsenite methyltransferase